MFLSIMLVSLIQNPSKGNRCFGSSQLRGLSYPYSSDVGGNFVEYLQQARLLIDKNIPFLRYIENNGICKNLRWLLEGFAIRSWPAVKKYIYNRGTFILQWTTQKLDLTFEKLPSFFMGVT